VVRPRTEKLIEDGELDGTARKQSRIDGGRRASAVGLFLPRNGRQ
jgi:hypothetical protein